MKWIMTVIFSLLLLGCTPRHAIHDPSIAKSEEEFLALKKPPESHLEPQTIKKSLPPPNPTPKALLQPISLTITHHMHIQDVLEILCQKAKIAHVIDPEIEGTLAYSARDQPLQEVLNVICHALNLRFRYKNQILQIERDLPYLKTYPFTFLAQTRSSETHMANSTQIMNEKGETNGNLNGSKHSLNTKSTHDFWMELEETLKNILPPKTSFSLQRQGGLIHVHATEKTHQYLERFLASLQAQMNTQVLIEAKIVEVTLKDSHKSGIDWAQFQNRTLSLKSNLGTLFRTSPALMGHTHQQGMVSLGVEGHHLNALLNFMESFGTVRTLSSPRITVLHNQSALLKVAENQVFFDVKYERQYLNTDQKNYGSLVASHSRIQSIPIGLVLSVHPAIQRDSQEIILNLRPAISRIVGTREDPSVKLMAAQSPKGAQGEISSEIPIVATREMDSILRLKSGSMAILGGLMIEGADTLSSGIPGTRNKGYSFLTSAKRQNTMITELVIFLKATIVDTSLPDGADQRLYQEFTNDPHPLISGAPHA